MIDHLSDGKFSQFERLFRYLYSLFRPRLALLAASIVVPLTFLLVSSAIDSEAGKWTVQVDTPPVLGFPSLYRATDNGGIKLPFLETVSNSTGGFSTYFNLPGLEKDDLRILIPGDISGSRLTPVSVQFISANGLVTVNLGSVLVPTYSESRFDLESKTNRDAYLKLPHLSPILLTLPDVSGYLKILYWSLWLACCMSGLLFFISIKTGSGALWRYSFLQSIWGRRLKELISKNPLLVLLILNTGLFVGVALCFTQRYPVSDDPIMAMIASGMIGVNPSEHLIYINIIVGFLIKCLAVLTPSIPWYDIFISGILVFSSSIIGLNLIRKLGIYRGLIAYAFCFIFFIFQSFYQLQFTTTAATLSIAGLSLALSSENFKIFNFEFAISLILLLLGSLIRPEATVLVIIISTPVLTFLAFRKRQFQLPIFLLVGLVGVILLKDIDSAYYEGSSDWKFYREYNLKRGALHGTSRLREFKSNDAIYSEIKWNENDFYMFSQDWIYQDLKVFSQENLNYLGQKLSRAGFSSGWYFFFFSLLRPFWVILHRFCVFFLFLDNWSLGNIAFVIYFGYSYWSIILLSLGISFARSCLYCGCVRNVCSGNLFIQLSRVFSEIPFLVGFLFFHRFVYSIFSVHFCCEGFRA